MLDANNFVFFEALRYFYESNRGKIRRSYKDLSKKYLDYNDKNINRETYLRSTKFKSL